MAIKKTQKLNSIEIWKTFYKINGWRNQLQRVTNRKKTFFNHEQ